MRTTIVITLATLSSALVPAAAILGAFARLAGVL